MKECEIKWLDSVTEFDLDKVGGKAYNLAMLKQSGFPVPNGFCITKETLESIFKNDVSIQSLLSQYQNKWNIDYRVKWGKKIQDRINQIELNEKCVSKIINSYRKLINESDSINVAIRSSGNIEDSVKYSFAGQFDTFLNVNQSSLISKIKSCLSSQYSEKILCYEYSHGLNPMDIKLSILIQVMVNARISGVLFTIDSINKNDDLMIVEFTSGLGDKLVSGNTNPTLLRIKKSNPSLGIKMKKALNSYWSSFEKIITMSLEIEKKFNKPQDIEWAIDDNIGYILQSRPITI